MRCRSAWASARAIFVDFHEVAERHRKHGLLGGSERIDAKRIFKPRDQHSKAERVEAAFASTRSSFSGARILPRSRATSAICSSMVNFIDNAAPTVCSLDTRYLHASLTIKFTQSS